MESSQNHLSAHSLATVGLLFYFVALFLPAFCLEHKSCSDWPGFDVLAAGWIEALFVRDVGPFVAFAWYANPVFAAATILLFRKRYYAATVCAVLATLMAATFLLGKKVLVSESGDASAIRDYGIGYLIWLMSMAMLCAGAIIGMMGQRSRAPE